MCTGVRVKCPFFWSKFSETQISVTDFRKKYSDIEFHENPSSGIRVLPCGRTDIAKLVTFRNVANASRNQWDKGFLMFHTIFIACGTAKHFPIYIYIYICIYIYIYIHIYIFIYLFVYWKIAECFSVVMVVVIRCQTLLQDLWTIWSCYLYVFYEYYYHIPSYSLGSIFYQCIYGFIPVW